MSALQPSQHLSWYFSCTYCNFQRLSECLGNDISVEKEAGSCNSFLVINFQSWERNLNGILMFSREQKRSVFVCVCVMIMLHIYCLSTYVDAKKLDKSVRQFKDGVKLALSFTIIKPIWEVSIRVTPPPSLAPSSVELVTLKFEGLPPP